MIDLTNNPNWRIELDELIRSIKSAEGFITVRCRNSLTHNIFSIKNFLGRRYGIDVSIIEETPLWANKIQNNEKWSEEDYFTTTKFAIKRKNIGIYNDRSWTFAVMTLGNKEKEVEKFCSSIRDIDNKFKHQILILGPRSPKYEKYKVDYIADIEKFNNDKYSRICDKKNLIIENAKNQNLLICHDRYYLDKNFLEGFDKYGYDFDFLSVDTIYEDKEIWFPHFVKMSNFVHEFEWNKERYLFRNTDYTKNNSFDNVFINGGLMIFKRDVVKDIRFNNCMFHHQIEDVEISKEFAKHHLPPKVNMYSRVITTKPIHHRIGHDHSYQEQYISAGGKITKKKKKNLYKRLRKILFKIIYNCITNKKLLIFLEKRIF